jgi:DinB superfamily
MKGTLKRLDTVHEKLSVAVRNTNPNLYFKRPAENEWSIAEVVQHLCLVEERITEALEKSLVARKPAKVGILKQLIPMRIVSLRFKKLKAPKIVTPGDPPGMDKNLENYDRARGRLKQLCAECGPERLKAISVKHPFLGDIDGVAAVSMLNFHEERHYKQIRDILKKLEATDKH